MIDFLEQCRQAVGTQYVLTEPEDTAPFLTDWRRRFTGNALAVIRPGSTAEVAAVVRLCNTFRVPIVPQGGNTGLVLGSVPDASGTAIVLSLTRLNRIRAIDTVNNTMTVESGCILETVQEAATDADRLFPLSLAAEGSCTIGGNLSSNAGGTAVLRYGNARELCLGLEVVTAQGDIWNGLSGLRKDNTGYDLRDLFIGAEGTLGVITAAVLKLFPKPKAELTALAALPSPDAALQLLSIAQSHCGSALTGFELMSDFCLRLVAKHYTHMRLPFAEPHAQYVLLELSDSESEEHANAMLEKLIEDALAQDVIEDAVVASSIAQSKALWNLREHIPLAQAEEGKNIKHDISVPISRIGDFIRETDILLQQAFPGCRMVTFGHLGDGNLHYNVSPPEGASGDEFIARQPDVNRVVHDSVHRHGGSISAEHGLGALKREEIRRYKSPVEMHLMQAVKQALDPLNLMNPGKIL
ncbi:MAG TPA: FAD-binding oxidoreductase [Noviherbaspirillum sp.]|nr:FAD-binding oxidoreductase [Noviherbaspirillum sp.]